MKEFCETELQTPYKTFQVRMRNNNYYPAEVIYICWTLDVNCKDAFGQDFQELMMLQGVKDIPEKVKKIYVDSGPMERKKLLSLLGITQAPKLRKGQKEKKRIVNTNILTKPVENKEKPSIASSIDDFFLETY